MTNRPMQSVLRILTTRLITLGTRSDGTRPTDGKFSSMFATLLLLAGNQFAAAIDEAVGEKPASVVEEVLPEADQMGFVEALEKAVEEEDADAWNNLIDWNRLVDTVTAGENTPGINRMRRDFKNGFIKAQLKPGSGSLAHTIVEENKNHKATYKFLRLGKLGDEPFALFRLKKSDTNAVNYHQYFLRRSKDGLVRSYDIYLFILAERISEIARRAWMPIAADVSKTILEKMTQPADPMIAALSALPDMQKHLRDGNAKPVMEFYRKLPEAVQRDKSILLVRMQAACRISDREYARAIADFRKFHPNDAALDFLLIDSYALKKDYESTLGCINRTNESLGGDGWMMSLRGVILAQLSRFEEAKEAVEAAIKTEPDLLEAYWNAVAVSILAKNFDDAVKYLNDLEETFALQFADVSEIPEYAEFVKSPQYSKWMESRK